jgi:hypothetical protein
MTDDIREHVLTVGKTGASLHISLVGLCPASNVSLLVPVADPNVAVSRAV